MEHLKTSQMTEKYRKNIQDFYCTIPNIKTNYLEQELRELLRHNKLNGEEGLFIKRDKLCHMSLVNFMETAKLY